jgi:hypothetical protein
VIQLDLFVQCRGVPGVYLTTRCGSKPRVVNLTLIGKLVAFTCTVIAPRVSPILSILRNMFKPPRQIYSNARIFVLENILTNLVTGDSCIWLESLFILGLPSLGLGHVYSSRGAYGRTGEQALVMRLVLISVDCNILSSREESIYSV